MFSPVRTGREPYIKTNLQEVNLTDFSTEMAAWLYPNHDRRHPYPADAKDRSEDHQQAVEACQHAADALSNGDLSRAGPLTR